MDEVTGQINVPTRNGEVKVSDYDVLNGIELTQSATDYLPLPIDKDYGVNELIDGYEAQAVPDNLVAQRIESAGYSIGMKKENILLKENGDVIHLVDGNLVDDFEHVDVNDILIDGKSINDVGELVLKDREMLGNNGVVLISATMDKKTKKILVGPEVLTRGFIYVKDNMDLIAEIKDKSEEIIKNNTNEKYADYTKIRNEIRENVGSMLYKKTESKPVILTVIQEV